jgi:hypothetical protein
MGGRAEGTGPAHLQDVGLVCSDLLLPHELLHVERLGPLCCVALNQKEQRCNESPAPETVTDPPSLSLSHLLLEEEELAGLHHLRCGPFRLTTRPHTTA